VRVACGGPGIGRTSGNGSVASRGSSLSAVSHGAGSGTFVYQLWSRSTPSTFCDAAAAFNLSNALEIVWP